MIFCIIGKSATGKDSIYRKIISNDKSLKPITTYTTRPKRDGERDSIEYAFVNEKELLDKKNKIIEKRVYHTVFGDWYYATIDDGNIKDDFNYIVIGTLESYKSFINYFGKNKVIPIYIEVEENLRYERAKKRESEQKIPKYDEMERRIKADNIDFSEENIKQLGIDVRFKNDDIDKCVDRIHKYIESKKC